jgi:DhnA family fructose-bisphosphate aldolase class Ia
MKEYKLNRLFNSRSGNCFDVAIDHGSVNESSFLTGIESIAHAVKVIVNASPDAVQLSCGQAHYLQSIKSQNKPSLVLRTDFSNVYGKILPRALFSRMIEEPVEQAIRLDAACVVVNLLMLPDQPELMDQCMQNILKLKLACDRFSMPLMIEPLVFKLNSKYGGYNVDGDILKIVPLVRQAVELGADIVKADPTDDVTEYYKVVETAGQIPVLVRGGGRASDEEILNRTYLLMQQGVKGIVYGRNVIQHANPEGMTRALMSIVHQNAKPDEVIKFLETGKEIKN